MPVCHLHTYNLKFLNYLEYNKAAVRLVTSFTPSAMDPQKRRIFVAFEEDLSGPDRSQKRQRKIAVSINKTATNADLAKEIAQTLQKPSGTLEISGGFELREQDGIDIIGDNDIVTARLGSCTAADDPDSTRIDAPSNEGEDNADSGPLLSNALPDQMGRFKIRFVTAEHALAHARQTPKEQSEPKNGIFAFDGESRTLEQEAARVLQWTSPDLMDVDDGACEHVDEPACSCPIAREIEEHGLSDTFHCRLTVDGSSCGNAGCPYSHVELTDSDLASPPHCSLCGDALGARKSTSTVGCPSGCAIQRFPREPADLQMRTPHLTIAWDGDKVDKIPIPSSTDDNSVIWLNTDEIVAIVETFLKDHQFTCSGLSLRIHFRDPVTETVRFSQSTLVSVCPSSSHLNQAYRRFPLFPTLNPTSTAQPSRPVSIDLHTSHAPIVACGCTPIRQLFPPGPNGPSPTLATLLLYAVKRRTATAAASASDKRGTISKESMYLDDPAWHPSIPQTPRGIATLLSSLYLFSDSVARKDIAAEQKVLALAYTLFRFPPAIRTLAELLLNKVPQPENKSALAEALYHALTEFSSRAPYAITSREPRRFETVRILLAYIAGAADTPSAAVPQRPVEEVSLLCTLSQKRLRDPVLLQSALVERRAANLHQPGGALYRPNHATPPSSIVELSNNDIIPQLLPRAHSFLATSALLLRVGDIGSAPPSAMSTLDAAARDFSSAIRRANQTDLASQGPLDLKSVDVVAPRIVVDQDGLLAVFTGRGCGTSRDVNFFRPTNGGDTEVDVNDVSHALQKVITIRKAEDTWQVDTFGDVSAVARPPDEAIVLCLDLSESMNGQSGVQRSTLPAAQEPAIDWEAETNTVVAKYVANMTHSNIVEAAEAHLRSQHVSCYRPWKTLSNGSSPPGADLLSRLSVLAARDLLSFSHDDPDEDDQDPTLSQLACFVSAISDISMKEEVRTFLIQLIDNADVEMIGVPPFNVPRKFVDFNASREWFEQSTWPAGHSVQSNGSASQLKQAVATWISGTELLPRPKKGKGSKDALIAVILRHLGEETVWNLPKNTPTTTLYALANRATKASYSKFALKCCDSRDIIPENSLTLDRTALSNGGAVEMFRCVPHKRKNCDVEIVARTGMLATRILLPQDAPVLAVLSYIDSDIYGLTMTDITLWHGLKDCGDGMQRGSMLQPTSLLHHLPHSSPISLECRPWQRNTNGAQRTRDESRHLSRLHLLKELFNVFLNRASSFDTTVSLVLGLVTFSNAASVEQELTPIFENFRQRLDRADACGDTAIYEALDAARSPESSETYHYCVGRRRHKLEDLGTGKSQDLETMLFSGERPLRAAKPLVTSNTQLRTYQRFYSYPIDVITVDKFPPRAEHPLLQQPVKSAASSAGMSGAGDDRMKRIMREIKAVVSDPHPNIDVYFNDRDMLFLKIILDVSKQGKVCIAELGRLWSSDITLKEIFSLVYGTLLTPDLENLLEIQASLKYYEDDGTYALAVADAVAKHTSKSRAEWRGELDE
ncbi:hypothetical protein FB451DRAFT_1169243 [Mycena latifolia]|nr:hypothetical protein FB451DRAFT_1169243 [Mycena latifolia]